MPRWSSFPVVSLAALSLTGCAESTLEPRTPPPVAGGQQVEQLVGASGGSVPLVTADGASFALTLPPGALDSTTLLRLETAPVSEGQRFHLRLLPEGLVLDVPATLRIVLPSALQLPSTALLSYDAAPIPFTREPDGALIVELSRFAGSDATAAIRDVAEGVVRLSGPALATSTATVCGGVPTIGSFIDGGLTDVEFTSADGYGRCVLAAVQRLAASNQFEDATRVAAAAAAYLQAVGVGGADTFREQAEALACARYRVVLDAAKSTTVGSLGQLFAISRPVIYWEMTVQQLGAVCAQVPSDEYLGVLAEKAEEAGEFYEARQDALTSTDSPAYAESLTELRGHGETVRQTRSLGAGVALLNATTQAMEVTAQPALLRTMLQAPWQRCRDTGQYDRLIELMRLTDNPPAVKFAANTCGVQIDARSFEANAVTETNRLLLPLGGVSATADRREGILSIRPDGILRLQGPIRALQCPAGSPVGSEQVELRLNGVLVSTLAGAVTAEPAIFLEMATLLSTAGINPQDFASADLSIIRSGDACAGFWGPLPQTLATISLVAVGSSVTTHYAGGGRTRSLCFDIETNYDAGWSLSITRLADGTHRIIGIRPVAESVTGFQPYFKVADRDDPELNGEVFALTPITVQAGAQTVYSAAWVEGRMSRTLTVTVDSAAGTAQLLLRGTGSTACTDGGPVETRTEEYTFNGNLQP